MKQACGYDGVCYIQHFLVSCPDQMFAISTTQSVIVVLVMSFRWGKLWNKMARPSTVADILCGYNKALPLAPTLLFVLPTKISGSIEGSLFWSEVCTIRMTLLTIPITNCKIQFGQLTQKVLHISRKRSPHQHSHWIN